MRKKGSTFKVISAIVGAVFFLIALYFLNEEDILYASLLGVVGILLIAIASFPFIKSQ